MKENYATIFFLPLQIWQNKISCLCIIGDILGVAIESYGDHYLGLHPKLARNS